MWLDRFSNTSTPTSNTPSRYRSPAPRRDNQLASTQRNGLGIGVGRNASSASIDLPSSAASSNVSLPLLQRRQTGSALRHEQRPPQDVPDPVALLKGILGAPQPQPQQQEANEKDLVDIDFAGLSLEHYLQKEDDSPHEQRAMSGDVGTAQLYKKKYEDLHGSITAADEVLASVESYLTNFKAELGQVSAEIESLQARSVQLNAQLDNRRKVEKLLGPAVEEISLSPHTVRAIAEGPIDDNFAKALTEIEARHMSVIVKTKSDSQTKAADDIKPLLDDLKTRAVQRIRDYLVSQIKALRSPNVNAQVIQQQTFLKHKELYPFLSRNNKQLADGIAQAYTYTMRWYYQSNFARYNTALAKLSVHAIDQNDLLGSDPSARKQNFVGTSKAASTPHDAFNLGRRADYLKSKDDRALPSHLAEDNKMTSYLEVPFRNFNQVLLDNLSAEYSVITELFSTNTYHQVSRRVAEIFEPIFTMGHSLTKRLVESTTDSLGILICIRLTQHFAFETQKRKVPVMDDYINYTNILLWPRFQKAMDLHVESLRKVPTSSNRGAAAAFSLVGGSGNASSTVAPHAITQRFGQFMHGILTLSANAGDDEPLSHSLGRLRAEYEALMGKLAKGAGDASKRGRFLYNNYSLVSTIISDTQGKLAEEQKEYFGSLVMNFKNR
ncbi:Vacuolar protein sorting-associated protein 52 [Exophiala xenobiotica]|uniref:Vacuolar protein sorting-associated protein 52 n=1 Tax=Lithohypha guttulata TaxID=1690604 RepID=A0ABR0JU50_9EURO|nr:Vacuolar protein sorting-associated protein 52 [Lithohypha guttulata]KAK5309319.1 Vacuolar protein sorting-associated protein 52 [Exophiala xenobiotica]